jgi:hypothetical protein
MIIRIALLLMFAALAVLASVDLSLWKAVPGLPERMTRLGLAALLSAFGLLVAAGLAILFKRIIRSFINYFSARQRLQRRLWFIQAKQDRLKQLFYFKTIQVRYFNELKRKRLLSADNRRHLQSLSKVLTKDLLSVKQQLPKTTYLQLQQEHVRCRQLQDIEGLLKLQQKIATLV